MKSILALGRKKFSIRRNDCGNADLYKLSPKEDVYLSVVIPTYNRGYQLANCLDVLFKQNYPPFKYQIIVVNDNSRDETPEVLNKYSIKYLNLKVIKNKERKGPYYSRNLGAKCSKGEIVIFTDDDCMFPSNWLSKIHETFQNPEVSCVQGTQQYRGKIPSLEPEGKFYLKMLQQRRSLDTKNLAIRRSLILKYRFNEAFETSGDRELGSRLTLKHIKIKYDPNIWVVHSANHSYKDQIKRSKNWGTNLAYIHKIYGWKGINPRFRYPFPMLSFFYLASFPYILFKFRSLRGSIAFISMLLVQGLYFKMRAH